MLTRRKLLSLFGLAPVAAAAAALPVPALAPAASRALPAFATRMMGMSFAEVVRELGFNSADAQALHARVSAAIAADTPEVFKRTLDMLHQARFRDAARRNSKALGLA